MFVFAADGAILDELQLLAEAIDIGLVHLVERRRHIGRRRGIAAQFLQRHQDLVGSALRAADLHLLGFGGDAVGADEVLVQAGVVDRRRRAASRRCWRSLPAGRRRRRAAPSCAPARRAASVTALLKTALSATIFLAASVRASAGPSMALSMAVAQRREFGIQRIDAGCRRRRRRRAPPDRFLRTAFILSRAPSVFLRYLSLSSVRSLRIHRGRPEQDVGGKAALGIHVARDLADRAHHLQPALRDRDLVHGLVLRSRHIDGEPAADGGKRDDGSGEEGADFHGI